MTAPIKYALYLARHLSRGDSAKGTLLSSQPPPFSSSAQIQNPNNRCTDMDYRDVSCLSVCSNEITHGGLTMNCAFISSKKKQSHRFNTSIEYLQNRFTLRCDSNSLIHLDVEWRVQSKGASNWNGTTDTQRTTRLVTGRLFWTPPNLNVAVAVSNSVTVHVNLWTPTILLAKLNGTRVVHGSTIYNRWTLAPRSGTSSCAVLLVNLAVRR